MDKLLLSLSFTMLLASLTVNSAPMPSSKIISAIEQQQQQQQQRQQQKKYGHVINNSNDNNNDDDGGGVDENDDNAESMQKAKNVNMDRMTGFMNDIGEMNNDEAESPQRAAMFIRRDEILNEMRQNQQRQNKMLGYFAINPYAQSPYAALPQYASAPGSSPFASLPGSSPFGSLPQYAQAQPPSSFYPPEFFDDFSSFYGYNNDEDEIMSRHNPGSGRRRPGNFKNSPIYYIRLPPQPYMFVPNLGYISQPPTYSPIAPPPPSISPFYNLPLDFISNGKPTNIYQWQSPATTPFAPQPQFVPQAPTYPSYQRPQRPYQQQRPINPYLQESKVTNLKGAFLFNGRPEEIFVLPPSSYGNSIYPDPRFVNPYY